MYAVNKSVFSNIFCIFREVKTLKKVYTPRLHISPKFLPLKNKNPQNCGFGI